MAVSGLQHISTFLEKKDTKSIQKWLMKTAKSMPVTNYERKENMAAHKPMEGKGIFAPNTKKTNPLAPDWKGQLLHNGETIRFSGWTKHGPYGEFLSLSVDKPKGDAPRQVYPREVKPDYDGDVPF
jgi:hypothetical protein